MIPIKWKVIQGGINQGYPRDGFLFTVTLTQGDGRAVAQRWLPVSDCKPPYLYEVLERLQYEVMLYSTTGRGV